MTAEDKASILFTLMWGVIDNGMPREEAKRCALIAVDEILDDYSYMQNIRNANSNQIHSRRVYWQEVKQEILKL